VQLTCQNVMLCLQIFGGGGEGAAYLPAACRAGEVVWSRGLLKKGEHTAMIQFRLQSSHMPSRGGGLEQGSAEER
jgi:hypothetical protein